MEKNVFIDQIGKGFTIRTKFLVLVGSIVGVSTLIYLGIFTSQTHRILNEELIKRGIIIVSNLSTNAHYGIMGEDTYTLSIVVNPYFQNPEISFVVMTNKDGKPLLWKFKESELENELNKLKDWKPESTIQEEYTSISGERYIRIGTPVITEIKGGEGLEALLGIYGSKKEEEGKVLKKINGYIQIGMNRNLMKKRFMDIILNIGGGFLLIFGISSAFSFYIISRITGTIRDMLKRAESIAGGDLTQKVEVYESSEIGILAQSFNTMTQHLNETMRTIKTTFDDILKISTEISSSSLSVLDGSKKQDEFLAQSIKSIEGINTSIKEIAENVELLSASSEETSSSVLEMSASIEEVAQNAESLSKAVEETISSLEEMIVSIKQVASNVETLGVTSVNTVSSVSQMDVSIKQVEKNAEETAKLSEVVKSNSDEGIQVVNETSEGMKNIKKSFENTSVELGSLVKKIQEIGSILNVIDDITEQTNLLALNAAIIAAQAGEHGKGFAVVADAIKKLAERTSLSTREIGEIISSIQERAKMTMSAMEKGMMTVEDGVKLSASANEVLRKIAESAMSSMTKSKEIAKATQEQAKGSFQVKEAMENMKDMIDGIAKATQEQAKGSDRISKAAEMMKEISDMLRNSTKEQEKGSKHITRTIENITEMIKYIHKATQTQSENTSKVVSAMAEISRISAENKERMQMMDKVVKMLNSQGSELDEILKKFRLN